MMGIRRFKADHCDRNGSTTLLAEIGIVNTLTADPDEFIKRTM